MNTIRCCISCMLPCGALDVIRVVHCNGRVEQINGGGAIRASDIMKAHPNHVLKKPSSSPSDHGGVVPQIVIVHPDAKLRRGKIYFLMPLPNNNSNSEKKSKTKTKTKAKKMRKVENNIVMSDDRYLSEILSEKASTERELRRGRVGVWRPNLDRILESPPDV